MRLALAVGAIVGVLAPAVGFFLVERAPPHRRRPRARRVRRRRRRVPPRHLARAHRARRRGARRARDRVAALAWRAAGDQALALVFYTGIAVGVVLVSAAGALNVNLFQFLFGSILTVTRNDLVGDRARDRRARRRSRCSIAASSRSSLDEEGSRVAGVPVAALNASSPSRRPHGRRLDAHRRHPPDRGAHGAARDRGDRVAWSLRSTSLLSMALGLGSVLAG